MTVINRFTNRQLDYSVFLASTHFEKMTYYMHRQNRHLHAQLEGKSTCKRRSRQLKMGKSSAELVNLKTQAHGDENDDLTFQTQSKRCSWMTITKDVISFNSLLFDGIKYLILSNARRFYLSMGKLLVNMNGLIVKVLFQTLWFTISLPRIFEEHNSASFPLIKKIHRKQ